MQLEHKERYNIRAIIVIIGEKMDTSVLQQVRRDFLPCHLIKYTFIFPLRPSEHPPIREEKMSKRIDR